jgi:TonB family protein
MKKFLYVFVLLVFCFIASNFAQEKTAEKQFEFKGILKDKNSSVFAGTPLFFNGNGKETFVSTNINGEFSIKLSPGNYELTVRKTLSETFKAYLSFQENALNPNNVVFVIEPNPICCGTSFEKPYPKILLLPRPPFPAAARAVRAAGEVVVEIKVDKDGKVISANAVSGHPLLRSASVQAAKNALFEATESDEPRIVQLTYVYLESEKEREVKRYSNLYRVEIIGEIPSFNISTAKVF